MMVPGTGTEEILVRQYKLSIIRLINSGNLMYRLITIVNNLVLRN